MIITADDRTGALEVAGLCADHIGREVLLGGASVDAAASVFDLGTRHLTPERAARRAADATRLDRPHLHKIDSLLRGNWAHEVRALARRRDEPVVVVAAFPAMGRTCENGTVLDQGVPVHLGAGGGDARTPVESSRPSDHLLSAGFAHVTHLVDPVDLVDWLRAGRSGGDVAVCDAASDEAVRAWATSWGAAPLSVLAGPSSTIGAGVAARCPSVGQACPRPLTTPVVVCGSLHPTARQQVEELRRRRPGVSVVLTEVPVAWPVSATDAAHTARCLAADPSVEGAASLLVIGGDTAAAVLGDGPVAVQGTVTTGVPWMRDGRGRVVVTRAGGFGGHDALVELVDLLAGGRAGDPLPH